MVKTCREWVSVHRSFIDRLWNQVFQKLDGAVESHVLPNAAACAAQVAADAAELVLQCADPSRRNPDGSFYADSERINALLARLENGLSELRLVAEKTTSGV